jgi:hypothetical protein
MTQSVIHISSDDSLLSAFSGSFMLKQHVILRRKPNAGTEEIFHSHALLAERIDNRSTWWYERSFEHEAENGEDRMERCEIRHVVGAILDATHEFGNYSEI